MTPRTVDAAPAKCCTGTVQYKYRGALVRLPLAFVA